MSPRRWAVHGSCHATEERGPEMISWGDAILELNEGLMGPGLSV